MSQHPDSLYESLWRRKLGAPGSATLGPGPEVEVEMRLTGALAKIPDVPVPSNFTARVLAAVETDEAQAARSRDWTLNWRRLWPRVAFAAAVLIFCGVSLQRFEVRHQRAALAKNVILLASARPLPSLEALENLDAIQRMVQAGHADGELLAALQ